MYFIQISSRKYVNEIFQMVFCQAPLEEVPILHLNSKNNNNNCCTTLLTQLYNYNLQNFSLKATSLYCTLFSLIHYSTVRPHKKLFVVRTVIWPLCSLSLLLQNCNNGGFKEENDGKIFKLSSSVSCQNGFIVCVHCSI